MINTNYIYETTILNNIIFEGYGLHSNILTKVRAKPADPYTGIYINNCKVCPDNVSGVSGYTILKNGVHVIEHFLSSLYACGINNLNVFISRLTNENEENDMIEFPIMDGCCKYFMSLFEHNIKVYEKCPREIYEVTEPIEFRINDRSIKILPHSKDNDFNLTINCMTSYPNYSTQKYSFNLSKDNFINEICSYRTHTSYECFNNDIKNGKLKGASVDNMFVYDVDTKYEGTEIVRHKILDIIGDLCVLGFMIKGEVFAEKTGHILHINLVKKIYKIKMNDGEQEPET